MKARGLGRVYQPKYRDRKTREWRTSPTWWIAYSFRGQKRRESSKSTKRSAAVTLLRKRQGEMGQGRLVGPDAERTTFADLKSMLLTDYEINGRKSLKRARISAAHLEGAFGLMRAVDITADRVAAYIRERQEATARPATIQKEIAALKRMFTLAVRAGKLIVRPYIPSLEIHNTRSGFFEEPEFRAVVAQLPEDIQPLAEFMYLTGWRVGEVLPLEWRQVDFHAKTVRLEPDTTKNDDGRTFPFGHFPALEALLRRQRERTVAVERATKRIIAHVFHRNGSPILDLRGVWERACAAAGFACQKVDAHGAPMIDAKGQPIMGTTKLMHDLRRTTVRNLERAGVARSVAMKLTGHRTEAIYRRYAIVSEADLSVGVAKLAALHDGDAAAARVVVPLTDGKGKVRAKQAQG